MLETEVHETQQVCLFSSFETCFFSSDTVFSSSSMRRDKSSRFLGVFGQL